MLANDAASAQRHLLAATRAAAALASQGGDSMARDQVQTIAKLLPADPQGRLADLAAGHIAFQRARAAFLNEELSKAARLMKDAGECFARASSPYAFWSAIYSAIAARANGSPATALGILSAPAANLPDTYYHLRGRQAWMRAAFGVFAATTWRAPRNAIAVGFFPLAGGLRIQREPYST